VNRKMSGTVKRLGRIGLPLVLALVMLTAWAVPVGAANPIVQITVTARVISITNSEAAWNIGTIAVDSVVYFSATGAQDDDYSLITNTGSVAVDVVIQGTDFNGTVGGLDWTLANAPGVETYSLYATNATIAPVYSIEVKKAGYATLCDNLAATGTDTMTWSMNFTAPSAFDAAEDGLSKNATVILVASLAS